MLRRIIIGIAQSVVREKSVVPSCFLIIENNDAYNDSGIPLLDKNTVEYCIEDTIIEVRRCFGGEPLKELIRDLVEDRRRVCYTGVGNMAVVSCQKEGS